MRALSLTLLLLAGCSDTRGTVDGSVPPGLDAGSRDGAVPPGTDGAIPPGTDGAIPPGTDGGGGGVDAGPPAPSVAFCVLGCAVEADCTTASPAFDEDNYVCEGTSCRYTGCVDDAECQATFSSADYVCRDPGTGVRSCLEGCVASADCGSATAAFDADNYTCDGGTCRYLGCNTDAECESTFGGAYGCIEAEPPPTPLPIPTATRNCVRRCASANDCATDSGAFGADNYVCEGGGCRYRGCNDDAECRTSLSSSSYVCR
ncbi:MAG: hypothetical protein H6719_21585 [Sandaracinaceae bacterium]|nr:hypothetical protein [Sandaracinaceae bacterium]